MDSKYRFSADVADIDRDQVHRWISGQSYWAPGRSRARQDAAIDGSRNFGVYDTESKRQVAYARVITDGVTFAWLCDVFVDPEVRGLGIAGVLIAGVLEVCEPLGLRRIALSTDDAHGLYFKSGFTALGIPETWMERIGNLSA
ncbi:GNAT family N-acetyltransferase [Cryobacterium sp. TMT1-21]|uniref:GNAT family N-acetyltransferase n=1 Tax=Cryobacterium shii TaxID=1259235 RepID=A0AAQ2C498_9MICO|nr:MULTISPECIES: GNAT family N-acetyltransferase [Cryobacterium]TFC42514.1 GNAT family N-acetyltransferase [Cryobacterium shii]TFC80846.1 GNAT family N-acetyltransferase [Cryobacterium sp. TmT2-59]TFD13227.1 GNAT family N-acetyltransferase [Cryobacterium sp. TMT1-21]TFD18648.1 GNAT family N-acetyltransferase [Cryobacterium sp. TMT4-10]TFD28449.1 GNAT family N-acetyltransferase [Cryobacterium sp. TMT2-23]